MNCKDDKESGYASAVESIVLFSDCHNSAVIVRSQLLVSALFVRLFRVVILFRCKGWFGTANA